MGMNQAAAASRANAMSSGMAASQGAMMGASQSQVSIYTNPILKL